MPVSGAGCDAAAAAAAAGRGRMEGGSHLRSSPMVSGEEGGAAAGYLSGSLLLLSAPEQQGNHLF